jgi:osmotically-inducible protein OsmY
MVRKLLATAMLCGLILQCAAQAANYAAVPASDSEITDRVMHKIKEADPGIAQRIRVSTSDGVVTLEGTLFTFGEIQQVLNATRTVPGVAKVQNRLTAQL